MSQEIFRLSPARERKRPWRSDGAKAVGKRSWNRDDGSAAGRRVRGGTQGSRRNAWDAFPTGPRDRRDPGNGGTHGMLRNAWDAFPQGRGDREPRDDGSSSPTMAGRMGCVPSAPQAPTSPSPTAPIAPPIAPPPDHSAPIASPLLPVPKALFTASKRRLHRHRRCRLPCHICAKNTAKISVLDEFSKNKSSPLTGAEPPVYTLHTRQVGTLVLNKRRAGDREKRSGRGVYFLMSKRGRRDEGRKDGRL